MRWKFCISRNSIGPHGYVQLAPKCKIVWDGHFLSDHGSEHFNEDSINQGHARGEQVRPSLLNASSSRQRALQGVAKLAPRQRTIGRGEEGTLGCFVIKRVWFFSPNLVTVFVNRQIWWQISWQSWWVFFETIDSGKYCEKSFTKFSDDFRESPNLVI